MNVPAIAAPDYDELVALHGLEMLKEGGDLSLIDGDLAMTKDFDLMMGDVPYNALFRLVEHWRCSSPHLAFLHALFGQMGERRVGADLRLEEASQAYRAGISRTGLMNRPPEFVAAWHAHWAEEAAAVSGHQTYAGCLLLLISNALTRFKDDLDAPDLDWRSSGSGFNGCSVGQVVFAAANGFRHEDEWAKTRPPNSQQKRSQDVLAAALGPWVPGSYAPPGRCPEVLTLLAGGRGFEGLTSAVLTFAHEVAQRRRAALGNAA